MLLPRRIKLLLATILAASSLTLVIAAYSSSGVTTGSKVSGSTLQSKILRRQNRLKEKPNAYEKVLLRKQAALQEERQVENEIPKHVPVKIKLKREKEPKFKDLNNSDWLRDFELEVTNTSNKPIYFLDLWLELPDTKSESGYPLMFPLRYGRAAFIDFDARPVDGDVPLMPGQTHSFAVEDKYQRGWKSGKARTGVSDPRRVKFIFVQLSFGDGTGFTNTGAEPYPFKRPQLSRYPGGGRVPHAQPQFDSLGPPGRRQFGNSLQLPALFTPANFFLAVPSDNTLADFAACDTNCPGTSCFFAKNDTYICSCKDDARTYQIVGSGDPQGQCSLSKRDDTWCAEYGVGLRSGYLCPVMRQWQHQRRRQLQPPRRFHRRPQRPAHLAHLILIKTETAR